MGFWKNSFKTFQMQGFKSIANEKGFLKPQLRVSGDHWLEVIVAGESYAGQYIPYIASGIVDAQDSNYFNLEGIKINDPITSYDKTIVYCGFKAPISKPDAN